MSQVTVLNVYCIRCCKWMKEYQSGWECPRCDAFLSVTLVGAHDRSMFHVSVEQEEQPDMQDWEEILSGYL